jgi:pimeloyl-ACP methyl ester carboxylesterase
MLQTFGAGLSDPTKNAERLDVLTSFGEASAIVSLGSLPIAVITAVERQYPGLGAGELARLTDLWNQGQQQWNRLSSAAHLVSVDRTSHHIQLDQPGVVIDEIARLLRSPPLI